MPLIALTERTRVDADELVEVFVRASGPGGQNVNKVASAVQLRFDIRRSPALREDVRARLEGLAGQRLTQDGVIVIQAGRFRTQERNRADALERLAELVRQAEVAPVKRRPTRPTLASKRRRVEAKGKHGILKAGRKAVRPDE